MGGKKTADSTMRILIVDDEPVVIEVLRELLEDRCDELVAEESGEKAVERLKTIPFSCLLTDKNLPGIDGLKVIKVARQEQPRCACILMTAFSSTESAVKALRLGANDYLEKPFEDLDLVAEKVDNAIRNQQARFERDELSERVRRYATQIAEKDAEVGKHKTESDLFEMVMDARIREATDDLRRKAKIFRGALDETRGQIKSSAGVLRGTLAGLDLAADVEEQLLAELTSLESVIESSPKK